MGVLDELLGDTAGGVRSGGGLGDCKFCRLSLRTSVATLTRRREGRVGVGAAVVEAPPKSEARSDGRGWRCLCTASAGTEGVWSRDIDVSPALASSRVPAPWWPDMSGPTLDRVQLPRSKGNGRGGGRAQRRRFYRMIGGLRDMGTDSFLLRDHKDGWNCVVLLGRAWRLNVGRARDVIAPAEFTSSAGDRADEIKNFGRSSSSRHPLVSGRRMPELIFLAHSTRR